MAELKLPTETITLPTQGFGLYPKDSLLAEGTVEMKYMGAKEEDILTNTNFISQGVVLDKLLESMVVTKIDFNELLVGDKNALLVAARILGHGKDYPIRFYVKGKVKPVEELADLTELKDKVIEDRSIYVNGNEFSFTLPKSKNEITFKILNHRDEKNIEKEIASMKKLFPEGSFDASTRYYHTITSVNGDRNIAQIREFVDNYFLTPDSSAFKKYYDSISPDVNMRYMPKHEDYTGEGVVISPGIDFFWPDAGV